jgi:hypothetical protein
VTPDPASQNATASEEVPKKCLYQDSDADDSGEWKTENGRCQHTWGDDWLKQMEVGDAGETCKFEVIDLVPMVWCPCFYEGKMGLRVTSDDDQINEIISNSESGCGVTKWNEGQWEQEEPPAKGGKEAQTSFDSWTNQKGRGYQKGSGYHCMAIKGDGGDIKDELMIGFPKSEYVKGMGELIDLMGTIASGLMGGAVLLLVLGLVGCFFGWRRYSKGRFWGKDPLDEVDAPVRKLPPAVVQAPVATPVTVAQPAPVVQQSAPGMMAEPAAESTNENP